MLTFKLNKETLVYPYKPKVVNYWTKKWGIKTQQLNEAILETGSIRSRVLRAHLAKKGIIFTMSGAVRSVKKWFITLSNKFNGTYENDF